MAIRSFRFYLEALIVISLSSLVLFTVGCSAQQTEEQTLAQLREMMSSGKLPAENYVADIESRFSKKKTGALARILRAHIKMEQGDNAGAASLLDSDIFASRTKLADHALWLRAKALSASGQHAVAINVADKLLREYPNFVLTREARILRATSAIAAGRAVEVPPMLIDIIETHDAEALLVAAKAYEAQGSQIDAIEYYRRTYFYAGGSTAANEAEAKLTALGQDLSPQSGEELLARADSLAHANKYSDAAGVYSDLFTRFPAMVTPAVTLRRINALTNAGKMPDAMAAFNSLPVSSNDREAAYRDLVLGYAKTRQWPMLRSTADAMRNAFPSGKLVPKTLIDAGLAARDARNRTDEAYYLNTAVASFPNSIEVATAQFEAAWARHENKNFSLSAQMLVDHLVKYAAKDTTNRGKAGYWAARDLERIGRLPEACAIYDGVIYRYSANWYGHIALNRMSTLKSQGNCRSTAPVSGDIAKAVANLKTVTVAAETAREKELERAAKSDELSTIGLFDWAIDELKEAKKTAANSPKINLALARHYRFKGDNTNAFIALRPSYPDYAQMFPEEIGREEWAIFYPLNNWSEVRRWANERKLDIYHVAGLIRQESVFTPRASSPAKAYGMMQLLLPTARSTARKYGSSMPGSPEDLFEPSLNIELGTAYMRDQLTKFGRLEYMAVAYNAGPGRVPQWRRTLPAEMDDFVEAIPFKETKGYVQGVIRNSAQYRRLYDENGNFKANVGSRPLRGEIDSASREDLAVKFPELQLEERPE